MDTQSAGTWYVTQHILAMFTDSLRKSLGVAGNVNSVVSVEFRLSRRPEAPISYLPTHRMMGNIAKCANMKQIMLLQKYKKEFVSIFYVYIFILGLLPNFEAEWLALQLHDDIGLGSDVLYTHR